MFQRLALGKSAVEEVPVFGILNADLESGCKSLGAVCKSLGAVCKSLGAV